MSTRETLTGFVPWPSEFEERYRRAGYWNGRPLGSLLEAPLKSAPDRIAVVSEARRVSYRELDERANRRAAGLLKLGIGPRDRVVVQLPNCLEFVELCLALFRIGAIPVMALPGHRRDELSYVCQHTEAVAYVAEDVHAKFDFRTLARDLLADAKGSLRHAILVGDAEELTPFSLLDADPVELPTVDAAEVALLQLSGGSTGTPKLIPRTHDDYFYSVRDGARICGLGPDTVFLVALPAAHNLALSSPGVLGALYAGSTLVMSRYPMPENVFPLIAEEAVTMLSAVPSLARIWLSAVTSRGVSLPSLKVIQVGGAKCDPALAEELAQGLACRVQQVFGMAEGLVSYTALDDPPERAFFTQGRPLSEDDELRIVDDSGVDVTPGEVGNLLTRGPYTIRGYYKAEAANRDAFTEDGFYRTGDLVRRTEDGYLVALGRSKDIINRAGEKVSPAEIEQLLLTHPSVHEAAVVGVPDRQLGERSFAFVVAAPNSALSRSALHNHLRGAGIATYKLPDRIELLESLPKTSSWKTDKRELARRFKPA